MDDGSKWENGYSLSTHDFDLIDNKKLVKILNNKYKLDARVYKDRKHYYIFIKNIEKFNFIIEPYIIKLFEYKLHKITN